MGKSRKASSANIARSCCYAAGERDRKKNEGVIIRPRSSFVPLLQASINLRTSHLAQLASLDGKVITIF